MVLVGSYSVSFDTDPDSGSSHFFIRIQIQGNYTDSTDPAHCYRYLEFVDNGGMDGTDVQIDLINNLEFLDNGGMDGTDVQVNLIKNLPGICR